MKYIFFSILLFATLTACNDDTDPATEVDCTIEGRWILEGLDNTLYQFTDSLQYTIYSTNGEFGPIEDAIPGPHEYVFLQDSLIIDLNFGNFSRTLPVYKCDCNVVELTQGDAGSILYKEGYNYDNLVYYKLRMV